MNIAASRTHLIVSSYHRIGFWTKDGHLLSATNTLDFFETVKKDMDKILKDSLDPKKLLASTYPINEFYDTRLVFDSYRNRFSIECLVRNMQGGSKEKKKHRVTLTTVAVSKTENPQDGWYSYWWENARHYQSIGISQKLLVIGYRPWYRYLDTVTVVSADDLAIPARSKLPSDKLPGKLEGYKLMDLKNPDGSVAAFLEPALQYGPSPADTHFLASFQWNNTLVVWGIDPSDPTTIYRAGVPVSAYASPKSAQQSNHPDIQTPQQVRALNARNIILKTVLRNGKLHAVWQDTKPGDGSQLTFIRLARVDVTSFPHAIPTGKGLGMIDHRFGKRHFPDPPNQVFSYYMPTLAVNTDGTMIINYCRSGSSIFPEARYSLYSANDVDVLASNLLHKGEYPLGKDNPENKLGPAGQLDYLGAAVDPSDDRSVWVVNSYAIKQTTGVGQYKLLVQKVPL